MKKMGSQEAFNHLIRQDERTSSQSKEASDVEEGFGQKDVGHVEPRPRWLKIIFIGATVTGALLLIIGVVVFYWFVSIHAEPKMVEIKPVVLAPAIISQEKAKEMIETNLRSFLMAQSNEVRLKYIYMPEDERESLDLYYNQRGILNSPLWKVERMELVKSVQGEIWFVVYRDLNKKENLVSFQRVDDDYLLHWSAMTAFCELPWPEFIVDRPEGPVTMRCYLRHYGDVWPLGVSPDEYHCFLLEDRDRLFSETAVMRLDAAGCDVLRRLPKNGRHPVTLSLGYQSEFSGGADKRLHIISLKHLRWQKMSWEPVLR